MAITTITEAPAYARAFRFAADLISAEGYDRHAETGSSLVGYSVIGALDAAADQVDLFSDSLWRAFCGWLVLRDLVAGTDDAGIARWETDRGGRTQDEVIAELRAAADSFSPRRKLSDSEILLVRQARDLADQRGTADLGAWLERNGGREGSTEATYGAALGSAQALIRALAHLVDDLTA